jgi:hypothetical protein
LRCTYSTIRRVGSEDAHAVLALERLAAGDEARQQQVAERRVVEQQRTQLLAIDGDVAHRLGDDRGQVHGLAGHQVQLAEEVRSAVACDLAARGVEDRGLALDDRDQRIAPVANAEQNVADSRGALLAVLAKRRELRC